MALLTRHEDSIKARLCVCILNQAFQSWTLFQFIQTILYKRQRCNGGRSTGSLSRGSRLFSKALYLGFSGESGDYNPVIDNVQDRLNDVDNALLTKIF